MEVDGEGVGSMSYIRIPYGPNRRSLAWRIGITVLPKHRRRGIGAKAHRLLAEQLLTQSDVHRVEADTDPENPPERRALVNAGFVQEGGLKGAQWRNGAWHDRVLFALTRDALG
nr:GNAT family protein [Acidiferrimicrobium sp. IK]